MKLRRQLLAVVLFGMATLATSISFAANYTYQVQYAIGGEKPKFYFFRFDNSSGAVEVLSFKKDSITDVEWQSVQARPLPFAFSAQYQTSR